MKNQIRTLSKLGGGCEIDSYGKRAGKGPLVQTELSATIGVSQDQTLITKSEKGLMVLENHPADSRVKVAEDGIVQTLSGRMGTGGNNVPMVVLEGNGSRPSHRGNGYVESEVSYTLNSTEHHSVLAKSSQDVEKPAFGLDRASFNQGKNAKFDFAVEEELSPTVLSKGPGGVLAKQSISNSNGKTKE